MSCQRKLSRTHDIRKRTSRVCSAVVNVGGEVNQGFATPLAFVRPLSSVSEPVAHKDAFLAKGFPTPVRTFSSVNSPMPSKRRADKESLATCMTFKGLLSRMSLLMFSKGESVIECFPTFPAFKGALPTMRHQVFLKTTSIAEGFPAPLTVIGLLSHVGPLVTSEG